MFTKEPEHVVIDYNKHNPILTFIATLVKPLVYGACAIMVHTKKSDEAYVLAAAVGVFMLFWEYRHTVRTQSSEQHWYNVHKLIRHSSNSANMPTKIGITKDAHREYKAFGKFENKEEQE